MSNVPADLKYTEHDEWIRVEADGTLTIGITDFAQEQLGDIVSWSCRKPAAPSPRTKRLPWWSRSRPLPTSSPRWPARSSPTTQMPPARRNP